MGPNLILDPQDLGEPFAQVILESLRRTVLDTKKFLRVQNISMYTEDCVDCLHACRWDRPVFVRRLLDLSVPLCDGFVRDACWGGSIEIFELLLSLGLKHPLSPYYGLTTAVERNHFPLVRHLIESKGLEPMISTITSAILKGHYDLADYLCSFPKSNAFVRFAPRMLRQLLRRHVGSLVFKPDATAITYVLSQPKIASAISLDDWRRRLRDSIDRSMKCQHTWPVLDEMIEYTRTLPPRPDSLFVLEVLEGAKTLSSGVLQGSEVA
ncbi:hypothetical protein BC829DRAFT_386705 [Chytridium lagenaria]|nr:hypothetical protein BC829DRAFT_386705 [Chytridium lagenaria]